VLSHKVRQANERSRKLSRRSIVTLGEDELKAYSLDRTPPNPQEQTNNLILWLGDSQASPDDEATEQLSTLAAILGAKITRNEGAALWLLTELSKTGIFELTDISDTFSAALTLGGWEAYEGLKHAQIVSRRAFMAMKFGEAELDGVVRDCFKPAVEDAGFELFTVTDDQPAGLIDNQIRAAIREARFVIADLTHGSNGAYFEAGFGEGLGLPVIYTCEAITFKEKQTHFDTNHMVTIPWRSDNLDKARRDLTATIGATLPDEAKR
ncbi:MAG: hypothetical protein WAW96_11670, partial [Alphaproteobacteria bacterium]